MSDIRFSVITPSYNQGVFLAANIHSVQEQGAEQYEHVVVDNQSTDGTLALLENQSNLRWLSEPDGGQSDALNKALAMSTNDWIVWLNADDFLLPGALEQMTHAIAAAPHARFFYSNIVHADASGKIIKRAAPRYSPLRLRHWFWNAVQLWQPGTVFHRCVIDDIGALDDELHFAMDFDFMIRAQDRFPLSYIDADLVAFRLHDQQKGHANEVPFIDERIQSTLSYWQRRGRIAHGFYTVVLFFVRGSLVFIEGLRQLERGNQAAGRQLVWRGLRRNPLAVLRPEHFGFWLRKLIGRDRYYRLRG